MSASTGRKASTWEPAERPQPVGAPGWLDWFDLIVVHSSGGKDSQEALRNALAVFAVAGVLDKVAALHIWLDRRDSDHERVEWHGVPALAAEQARRAGLPLADGNGWAVWDAREQRAPVERDAWAGRLHFARRTNRDRTDWDGDLLDDIATRRKLDGSLRGWPTMWTRYCTSDWKTAVGRAFTEYLCEQIRRELGLTRPVRVLQVMGFRAEESRDRAARSPYALNYGVSAQYSRHVWEWLPIHTATVADVWAGIRASGVPYHPVYDEGMSRLSCRRCILASRGDLATAARLDPAGHAAYVAVEADQGDPFQVKGGGKGRPIVPLPLAAIEPAAGPRGFAVRWDTCPACGVPTLARSDAPRRACPKHAATGVWGNPGDARASCPATEELTLFESPWSAV